MTKSSYFAFENEHICRFVQGDIAVYVLKSNVFENLTNVPFNVKQLEILDKIEKDNAIRSFLILNEPGTLGKKAYGTYLHSLLGEGADTFSISKMKTTEKRTIRARELNIIRRLMLKLFSFGKPVFIALRGNVATPFFGISLAFDFRFGGPEMCFSLCHVDYGLHPSGGLPFLLPRFVGQQRAIEYLLCGGEICAEKALHYGLINRILPADKFEDHCFTEIEKYCKADIELVSLTKRMTQYYAGELRNYFDLESGIMAY